MKIDEELLEYANKHFKIGAIFKSKISDHGVERECQPFGNKDSKQGFGWEIIIIKGKKRIYCSNGMYTKNINNINVCSNPTIWNEKEGWCEITNGELFILPEKWCIKVSANKTPIEIYNWRNISWINSGYIHSDKKWEFEIKNDYTEITLEQFKKYVLKKDKKRTEIPKYIKCIEPASCDYGTNIIGQIYEITGENSSGSDWFIKDYPSVDKRRFIWSTKEAYEAQFQTAMKINNLTEGLYYYREYLNGSSIIGKCLKSGTTWAIGITPYNSAFYRSNYFDACKNIRRATDEEIKWVKACEKANKFISKEEALNPSTLNCVDTSDDPIIREELKFEGSRIMNMGIYGKYSINIDPYNEPSNKISSKPVKKRAIELVKAQAIITKVNKY